MAPLRSVIGHSSESEHRLRFSGESGSPRKIDGNEQQGNVAWVNDGISRSDLARSESQR